MLLNPAVVAKRFKACVNKKKYAAQIDAGLGRDRTFYFQGVIDAAVNGGIAKYQEAFFSPNFLNEFPSHLLHVAKLQALMMDQVRSFGNIAKLAIGNIA